MFDRAQSVTARNTERSGGPFPFPIESKGTERSNEHLAVFSPSEEQPGRASTSTKFTLGPRVAHREARHDLMNPPKWLSVAPPAFTLASPSPDRAVRG